MYNDTAKKNVLKAKSIMDNRRKYETTPQKKNVWKPKSKKGQPKKVWNDTAKNGTYGSLELKWDNRRKYETTPQKKERMEALK